MMRIVGLLVGLSFSMLSGCATQGVQFPRGTLMLGEVSHVLTRGHIAGETLGGRTKVKNLYESLRRQGITDYQIDGGRVVVVRQGIYWNNVVSGIKHDMLQAALVPENVNVEIGNIIEREATSSTDRPSFVVRVRAKTREEGNCRDVELPTDIVSGLLGAISLVGPSGAATLYCKGIEKEGWQRPRTFWHKLPTAATAQGN